MKLKVNVPLDPGFAPMVMEFRAFEEAAEKSGGKKIVIGIERNKGYISTYEMTVFEDGCGHDDDNFAMAERIVKTLLWARGGYKIIIAGSESYQICRIFPLAFSPFVSIKRNVRRI